MKIIGKSEAKELGLQFYFTGKPCKHGHVDKRYVCNGNCWTCHKLDVTARYELKKDVYLKISNDYYYNNKETYKEVRHEHYLENKETILARNKKWKQEHKPERAAERALRRANEKQATPLWSNLKIIKEFYKNCPKGFHVDHVVPLVNKIVCGLHTEHNLQYLPASENMSKNNTFKAYIESLDYRGEPQYLETHA